MEGNFLRIRKGSWNVHTCTHTHTHTHKDIGTFRDFLLYVLLLTPSEDSGGGHVSIVYMNTEVQEQLCLLI